MTSKLIKSFSIAAFALLLMNAPVSSDDLKSPLQSPLESPIHMTRLPVPRETSYAAHSEASYGAPVARDDTDSDLGQGGRR